MLTLLVPHRNFWELNKIDIESLYNFHRNFLEKSSTTLSKSGRIFNSVSSNLVTRFFYEKHSRFYPEKFWCLSNKKSPNNRTFFACILFRHIKMELMIGLEPTTYALPRRCATDCATSATNNIIYCFRQKVNSGKYNNVIFLQT